jgi:AcrR family transcriptional regulator
MSTRPPVSSPSAVPSPTRDRLVVAAVELFCRQGFTATGVKEILTKADARFSSLYHFFPGGKEQLAEEAITTAGAQFQQMVEDVWDGVPDVIGRIAVLFAGAAAALEANGYQDACPIGTIALEVASTNERLRLATNSVFEAWTEAVYRELLDVEVPPTSARQVALTVIVLLEGAFVLSRSARSIDAMQAAGAAAVQIVQASIGPRITHRSQDKEAGLKEE